MVVCPNCRYDEAVMDKNGLIWCSDCNEVHPAPEQKSARMRKPLGSCA